MIKFNKRKRYLVTVFLIMVLFFGGYPSSLNFKFQDYDLSKSFQISQVEAASVGPYSPSTASTEAGGGTINWTNPTYATSSDNFRATATIGKSVITYYLKATGFGFNIPSNARIDGIVVEIERSVSDATSYTKDYSVKIIQAGTISGDEKADTVTNWPVSSGDTYATYGASNVLWGLTWTAADINNSGFGAAVQAKNTKVNAAASNTAQVDHIRITVYYTLPTMTVGTTGSQTLSLNIPSSNNYIGGAFIFVTDINTATVTQMIITDTGTVNANANLSNVDIYYETAGTCTYDANETLFGTGTTFNASEKATITGTMSVGTSQVCVYVVLDVGSGAAANETIEIEISNPSTEVTITNGSVTPATAVLIDGTTTLQLAATVSCTASAGSTDFGTLTTLAITTSSPNITITSTCTYGGGCTITVKDLGNTSNPGLDRSTSPPHLIPSADATLAINVEGYGIQATTTGSLTLNPKYDKINNDVGGLTTPGSTNLATSTAPYADQTIIITHKAAISELTPAGDYVDTITYSCNGN